MIKRFMVYYVDATGAREGAAVINAKNRAEAIRTYRMFYNVDTSLEVRAVPRFEVENVRRYNNET